MQIPQHGAERENPENAGGDSQRDWQPQHFVKRHLPCSPHLCFVVQRCVVAANAL
jgi:hypothetical protein